ncbi:hypothetical protein LINPERHAP1_LOCUS45198, partial [Linum perenne]
MTRSIRSGTRHLFACSILYSILYSEKTKSILKKPKALPSPIQGTEGQSPLGPLQ